MIYSPHPSSPPLTQSDTHLHDTLMLGLSKHGSNINGVIHLRLKPSIKMCGNTRADTHAHRHRQSGLVRSEGRIGPFVETKVRASREYWVSEGMSLCGKCQLKRLGHFFFSTFPVWHLLHNGPFNSRWCLGIFRWGQFERLCWHSRYNETPLGDKPWWTGWSERRHWHWMWNMHWCAEVTLWGSPDPSYQGLLSVLLLLPRKSEQIRLSISKCFSLLSSHVWVDNLDEFNYRREDADSASPKRWRKPSFTHERR